MNLREWVPPAALLALALPACSRLPTAPARVPPGRVQAIAFVDWTADGYAAPTAGASLQALAATGANTVTFVVTAYQATPGSSAIRSGDPRTPTRASVIQAAAAAKSLGVGLALKPHVDLDDGTWRGRIQPVDAVAWFDSYRSFLLPWAQLADSLDASQLVVGTELAGTLAHEAAWRETIRRSRAAFRGELLYAASWDEAGRVPFWDALDAVGVDFYFPVAQRRDPGRLEILAGWQPWLERLRLLHRQTGKPVLLTEVGYRSVDGAGMEPYSFGAGGTVDLVEQADLYWAALQATGSEPWVRGLCWWNWRADGSGGPANTDYTPLGKPAAQELAAAW